MKKSQAFIFLFLSGFFTVVVSGQQFSLSDPIPPDTAIRIGKLGNGLTYYIKRNSKPEKRLELRLAVNAGSICETDGQQGLAHFVEHMCFNGTKNFPGNKIVDVLEEMGVRFGADLNASTGFDQTVYMLQIPSDNESLVDRGFQVLGDWAHQVSMEESEIDKERSVIIEEWRLGLGADERMMQKYLPVLFKGSRYAERLPIGKVEIIKSFDYDTLRSFYKTWYRPDLMAVIVVGDIDPEIAERKIRESFAGITSPFPLHKRIEYPIPGNTEPLISIVTDKEATGYGIEILFKHPHAGSGTYGDYRNTLMRMLCTSMLNSRFGEIAVRPDAPFLYAGAGYGAFIGRTIDVYSISASAKENQMGESIRLLLTENEKVRRYGFTPGELERVKKDFLAFYENISKEADKTESASYADEFIRNYMTRESIPGYIREYELVKEFLPGITSEEINALAGRLTTRENILVLVTAQDKEGIKVPGEDEVSGLISSVMSGEVEAYVDKVNDAPLLENDPVPTQVVSSRYDTGFGFTELNFGNGARVILKPTNFKNDEILFSAFSPGGSSLYPDEDIMSATVAASVISQSGLGNYDFTGLQKKLSGNTAKLNPYISELREGVSGSCSPKDLETLLQLNYLYFTGPRRDQEAFESYISRIRNMIKPMRANPQVIFSDTLSKIITKSSPRVISVPTDEQIGQVDLDRVQTIFRERFAGAGDFTFIMTGNFNSDSVRSLLAKYIGGIPAGTGKETWRDVTPGFPEGHVSVVVPKNSEPQSLVSMVWKGDFRWKSADRVGFAMLMDILAIKCRESMREDQGGVYGVSIDGSPAKYPVPTFTISSSWGCDPEKIDSLKATVLIEMEKIKRNGPEETDLVKVKETLIRERETLVKENSYWLSALQNHYYTGDPLRSMEDFRDLINSFTVKDIRSVARKYLDTENYVEVALTPAEGVDTGQ